MYSYNYIIFSIRQDLVYAKCGYMEANLFYHSSVDVIGLERAKGLSSVINLTEKRKISEMTMNRAKKEQPYLNFLPEDKKKIAKKY